MIPYVHVPGSSTPNWQQGMIEPHELSDAEFEAISSMTSLKQGKTIFKGLPRGVARSIPLITWFVNYEMPLNPKLNDYIANGNV